MQIHYNKCNIDSCTAELFKLCVASPLPLDWFLQVNPRNWKTSDIQSKSYLPWRKLWLLHNTLDAYYQFPQAERHYLKPERADEVKIDVEDGAKYVKGTELIALETITRSPPQEEASPSVLRSRFPMVSLEVSPPVSYSPTPTRTTKPKERRERASSQPFPDILDIDVSRICWECRKVVNQLVAIKCWQSWFQMIYCLAIAI